jgi:hypothetical protein
MTVSLSSSVTEPEEELIKKNYWRSAFASLRPTEQILPFVLSIISLANIAKASSFLMKRDIQNLTNARELQERFASMDPPLDHHLNELQKDLIHTVRKLAVEKIITKIALVSSLVILSIGEYLALSGAPVPNLRLYSLVCAALFGATSLCQYAYQGVEGLLLERLIEMQED